MQIIANTLENDCKQIIYVMSTFPIACERRNHSVYNVFTRFLDLACKHVVNECKRGVNGMGTIVHTAGVGEMLF